MKKEVFVPFRQGVINLILATDMSFHFDFLKKLETRVKTGTDLGNDDKTQMLCLLMKLADISNVLRPFEIAKYWGKQIAEEFCNQGKIINIKIRGFGEITQFTIVTVNGQGKHGIANISNWIY
jgi:hypothetical protein